MVKRIFTRIKNILKPPKPKTMEEIIQNYRNNGISIGENCHLYSTLSLHKDCFLLSIGDNVTISTNVTFLMHDNAICKPTNNEYTDILGRVTIEDNCFIGEGSIIMPGVTIAKNGIIGAGSVVTKSTKPFCVYAGNPAKYICSVDEYLEKSKPYMVNIEGYTKDQVKDLIETNKEKLRER